MSKEYNDIYGLMGSCIGCHNTNSVEQSDDGAYYFCNNCHVSFSAEDYEGWLKGEEIIFDHENGTYFCDPTRFAPVYDEEGMEVRTECCDVPMQWDGRNYICPECEEVIDRREFFAMIGAQPPGDLCYTCDQLYPCIMCHLGYELEDDF